MFTRYHPIQVPILRAAGPAIGAEALARPRTGSKKERHLMSDATQMSRQVSRLQRLGHRLSSFASPGHPGGAQRAKVGHTWTAGQLSARVSGPECPAASFRVGFSSCVEAASIDWHRSRASLVCYCFSLSPACSHSRSSTPTVCSGESAVSKGAIDLDVAALRARRVLSWNCRGC